MKKLWNKIEKLFDVDTYEGWKRNGLAFVVGCVILGYGLIIGTVLFIMKCMGKL